MEGYINYLIWCELLIILFLTFYGILANLGFIKGDNLKIPRIHIAISYLPGLGFMLTLPLFDNMKENPYFIWIQAILILLGIIVIISELRNMPIYLISAILIYSIIIYFALTNIEKSWKEPVGMASYSLLAVVLGLDLLKTMNPGDLFTKNYLILLTQTIFQLFAVFLAKECENFTWLILSGIGLFECTLLIVFNIKNPEQNEPEKNK